MNKVSQINVMLGSLSYEELKEVKRNLDPLLKEARKEKANDIRHTLSVGDTVTADQGELRGRILTVVRVTRTKAVLRESNMLEWNVPLNMIEPTDTYMAQLENI